MQQQNTTPEPGKYVPVGLASARAAARGLRALTTSLEPRLHEELGTTPKAGSMPAAAIRQPKFGKKCSCQNVTLSPKGLLPKGP